MTSQVKIYLSSRQKLVNLALAHENLALLATFISYKNSYIF
jgi:hypothetical protein